MDIIRKGSEIYVSGNAGKIENYESVNKEIRKSLKENPGSISLVFRDAVSLNSYLISCLIQLKKLFNVEVSIKVENHKLYDLLGTLNLTEMLNVTKIKS